MFSSGKTRSQGNTPVGDRSLGSKPMVVVMDRSTGRLNLAFQELKKMPRKFVNKYGEEITELDLTSNEIRDFQFLLDVPNLETLILDKNNLDSHVKFPRFTRLTSLSVNNNAINNLSVFAKMVTNSFPNLKFLSMMNNEAAPSYFNGGTFAQFQDYRHYVIAMTPSLLVLDDTPVKIEEREEGARIYCQHRSSKRSRKKRNKHSIDGNIFYNAQ